MPLSDRAEYVEFDLRAARSGTALVRGTPALQSTRYPPSLTTQAISEAEREVLASCLTDLTVRAELLDWLTRSLSDRTRHHLVAFCAHIVYHSTT